MHSQQSSQSNLFAVLCEEFFPTDRLLLWRLPATAAFSSVPDLASNCYFLDGDRRPRPCNATGSPSHRCRSFALAKRGAGYASVQMEGGEMNQTAESAACSSWVRQ